MKLMRKTVTGLIAHCKNAVEKKVQYVYGAKMQVLTLAQIKALRKQYGSAVWQSDDAKAGRMCCDCSGLISSYTGVERSSAEYKRTASAVASIQQLKSDWSKYVGWGIWLNGHIGVVSDTPGYYYAMDGSGRNAVHYPLNKQPWICVIKLKDITYESEELSVDDAEKLAKQIELLKAEVEELRREVANGREKYFETLDDVPSWAKATVRKLVEREVLKGDGKDLDLSYTLLRLLVINDRAGVYDVKNTQADGGGA